VIKRKREILFHELFDEINEQLDVDVFGNLVLEENVQTN